jgi:hypothetical protein
MDDRQYGTKKLREAEWELNAARTRTAVSAAAKRLQRAKVELKGLETEAAERTKERRSGNAQDALT